MLKHWLIFLCLSPLLLRAQVSQTNDVRSATDFPAENMKKVDGILPVYLHEGKVYLEFPRAIWGRELLITAQIDRGFDLVNRPAKSLGVVRLQVNSRKQVTLARPSYADRLPDTFQESVIQTEELTYPVLLTTPQGGLIIDVTNQLSTGNEWFSYSYAPIRGLDYSHASVTGVSAFADGVCFHIERRHGYAPERANVSSAVTTLPEGSMPLQLSCTIRILPTGDMPIRLTEQAYGFKSIAFGDHVQDPYRKLTDSLMTRRRLEVAPVDRKKYAEGKAVHPLCPLTLYLDRYFPKRFFPAVREAVAEWNKAFRQAGFLDALQLKELGETDNPGTCQALLSYDLGTPAIECSCISHPRTGEILSSRINVGHGWAVDKLIDYWWQEGVERNDSVVATLLLKGELLCAIGDALGLCPSSPDPLFLKSSSTLNETSIRAVATGYRVFPEAKDCYDDRDLLRQWRNVHFSQTEATNDPIKPYAEMLQHLQKQFCKLNKAQQSDNKRLYQNGLRLYGRYLKEITLFIGSNQPATVQQEAMHLLAEQFFEGSARFNSRFIIEQTATDRHSLLTFSAKEVFTHLLSQQTISTLQRAEWYAEQKDKAFTAQQFFQSLYASLFGNFEPERNFTYEQLDLMLSCVEVWRNSLQTDEQPDNLTGKMRLETEWAYVKTELKKLAEGHSDPALRSLFRWMSCR